MIQRGYQLLDEVLPNRVKTIGSECGNQGIRGRKV